MAEPNATNTVNPATFAQSRGVATLPANPDDQGFEPTQSLPVNGQLQPPTQAPAQQPMQLQPSQPAVTTPAQPPTSNPKLFGFIGSVLHGTLRALAGPQLTTYTTDKDGRTIKAPNQPADTAGAQGRRLAAHALEGLAAGASVPQQKSGAASALAGLGAGASAVTASQKAQDDKARQQERENAEAAEQKKMRMYQNAYHNAMVASAWQHMTDTEQDRDPARQQHLSWAKAAEDSGVPVKYVTESEAHQLRDSDPMAAAKYQILPVGMETLKDSDGNVVMDESGKPKMQGKFALIDGLHDGNIAAPASFVSELQKYGPHAGLTKEEIAGLKAGDDLSMQHFVMLAAKIQEGKKNELQGWAKPEQGYANGKPVQINSITRETRAYPEGVVPNIENKAADAEQQRKLREAQTAEAWAKAKKAVDDGKSTQADQAVIAESIRKGRMDPSQLSKRSKDYNAVLAEADRQDMEETGQHFNIAQAQTDYTYANKARTKDTLNMINGMVEPGGAIDIAKKAASRLPQMNSKTANKVFNIAKTEFGDNALTDFHTAMLGLADEYSKVMGGGVSSDTGRQQALDILNAAYSKGQMGGAIQIMQSDIAARKRAIIGKNRYLLQEYGDSTQAPAQNPQSGQTQNQTPAPTTHSVSIATAMKNHPGMTEDQVRAWAKQNNYEVVQ